MAAFPLTDAAEALAMASAMLGARPILVASDFDGTLAHLSSDPWGARILPAARRAMRRLAVAPGTHVAFISGRTVADLAARARVGGADYLGNHGMERGWLPRGGHAERMTSTTWSTSDRDAQVASRLADAVPRLVPEAWLIVERKIPAVAFHFRTAPDVAAAALRVRAAVERLDPERVLVRYPGRRALELRPVGAPAKGEAMAALLDELRPRVAFMLGDDRHDAGAFDVLRAARVAGTLSGLAIAVAAHPDSLSEVAPRADIVLSSPVEAARFLAGLADRLKAS